MTLFCFDFQPKEIPTTNNIGTISAINTYQMIAIKAKLLQKGDKNKVKTDDGEKFLVNAYLGDPSGTIKVTLWDRFCDLEERKTYPFDNPLVRGEYKTKDIILVTPKTGCKAVENTPFKENLNYQVIYNNHYTCRNTWSSLIHCISRILPMQIGHSRKIHSHYL